MHEHGALEPWPTLTLFASEGSHPPTRSVGKGMVSVLDIKKHP